MKGRLFCRETEKVEEGLTDWEIVRIFVVGTEKAKAMAKFVNLFTDVVLEDRETGESFSDKLRFIFIELPSFTKEEREQYDEGIKVYRDNLAVMAFEREEGFAKGVKEGIEKTARKMREMGLAMDLIIGATGLTVAENEVL